MTVQVISAREEMLQYKETGQFTINQQIMLSLQQFYVRPVTNLTDSEV